MKNLMKRCCSLKPLIGSFVVAFLLAGLSQAHTKEKTLKIGVTAGPHVEILTFLKGKAEKEGLALDVIEFNDFILPNIALAEGAVDVNIYQHKPFLDTQKESRGFSFIDFGKTILLPMGAYSSKHKTVAEIPRTGKIGIPNDPSNGGRALLVLQDLGLLKLKKGVGANAMVTDIIENPKHLKIVEVEAPQLPRSLEDVDLALINMDWVLVAGLDPSTALAQEKLDSPYANIIVIRQNDQNCSDLQKLKNLYQSSDTKAFIQEKFKGAILAAW